ncbi:DUF4167 domain-containing protein [Rhodobacteraceae bacterium M382]|nr:DUF4167 domain-containing protein [Rhodobacteraceae bacterium M382]
MRSSKSRSRNKSNRNRPSGTNVINRVFDSSGPEGKVRGTPQQIIDKYNQLARDAQLSNDRVATENFQQHAEHYQRLLSEAMREMEAKREEQERQNRERQADRDRERAERQERESVARSDDPAQAPQPDVRDMGVQPVATPEDTGLVDTPEGADKPAEKARPPRKPASPRKNTPRKEPAAKSDAASSAMETAPGADGVEGDGAAPAKKPRRKPSPRKKVEAKPAEASPDAAPAPSGDSTEAAE